MGIRHLLLPLLIPTSAALADGLPFAIVHTGQSRCYGASGPAPCPSARAQPFWGQDAQVSGNTASYQDNGDGTVTDRVTGLMWTRDFQKSGFAQAVEAAKASRVGGYDDWRVPTIRELYSLIQFDGATGSAPPQSTGAPSDARPYLDTTAFRFEYPAQGRFIDAQYISSTVYTGTVMAGEKAFFGVNFADGRIKGYPQGGGPGRRQWYLRLVRGNPAYGANAFADNGDGTVSDRATGLMWAKDDSGAARFRSAVATTAKGDGRLDWGEALAFCAGLSLAGKGGWRLPSAKELHSIVDYSRSPAATASAAIDPVFAITAIRDEDGKPDWPYAWTATSHLDGRRPGDFAVYFAFGRAGGHMRPGQGSEPGGTMMGMGPPGGGGMGGPPVSGPPPGFGRPPPPGFGRPPPPGGGFGGAMMGMGPPGSMEMGREGSAGLVLMDVHGAGAQRSSPKSGDESRLPKGAGPQGDVLRIYNSARCVRSMP